VGPYLSFGLEQDFLESVFVSVSYGVGCCWILMAMRFVAGVMNLLGVATIAALVLAEKILPRGDLVGRVAGGILVLVGVLLLGQFLPVLSFAKYGINRVRISLSDGMSIGERSRTCQGGVEPSFLSPQS
jgi:cytochrome c biogenesis protein CcdA